MWYRTSGEEMEYIKEFGEQTWRKQPTWKT